MIQKSLLCFDAKAINESRAAEAAQEVIEDTAEEEQPAEQTAQ